MEFLFLIILNIIMGTGFYLLISLKLERRASEFREKRMMRIMDDVIKEFNLTAERNISLLESRIQVMRKMLEQAGDLPCIDISHSDGAELAETVDSPMPNAGAVRHLHHDTAMHAAPVMNTGGHPGFIDRGIQGMLKFGVVRKLLHRIMHADSQLTGAPLSAASVQGDMHDPVANATVMRPNEHAAHRSLNSAPGISKGFDEVFGRMQSEQEVPVPDEQEIRHLFTGSFDKYELISDLYKQGCPVELLSKCSGIPLGEIRLVLNLNNS